MRKKERLMARVLVAGPRQERLQQSAVGQAAIADCVAEVIADLRERFVRQGTDFSLLTGAESGVDRLVAEIARDQFIDVRIVTPVQPSGGGQPDSVDTEIISLVSSSPEHPAVVDELVNVRGEIALAYSNILLVVWDGLQIEGRGALYSLLTEALRRRMPVIWVNPNDGLAVKYLFHPEGRHAFYCLAEACHYSPESVVGEFVAVDEDGLNLITSHIMKGLMEVQRQILEPMRQNGLSSDSVLDAGCQVFDKKAVAAQRRHIQSIYTLYGLSAMAVLLAILGAMPLVGRLHLGYLVASAELMVIAGIVLMFLLSKKKNWHETWVRSRFMAEQFRYVSQVYRFLVVPPSFLMPSPRDGEPINYHILHSALVLQGLPCSLSGCVLQNTLDENLTTLSALLDEQIAYQKRAAHKHHLKYHKFERIILTLFGCTALGVVAHFGIHSSWLLIMTGFLPAAAAAMHAVSVKLEMKRMADLANATRSQLETIKASLEMLRKTEVSSQYELCAAYNLSKQAINAMVQDTQDWQRLLAVQGVEMPA